MNTKILSLFFLISLTISACTPKEQTCIIKGKVINRPYSSKLIFVKYFDDVHSSDVIIPIKDGVFSYEFNFSETEAYNLIFKDEFIKGSMNPIVFYPIDGCIEMTIHPRSEFRKNIVKGGKINQEYAKYLDLQHRDYTAGQLIRDSISLLHKNDLYHTQVVKDLLIKEKLLTSKGEKIEIWNQVRKLEESGEGLTQLAKKLELKKDSLNKFLINEELNIIENEINIINYTSLISDVKNSKPWPELFDIERLKSIQKKYASKFKDHPYTKYSNELLWGINEIKKGGDFFDFTLPDMNGKLHTLSKEADGKFALIDIWAPWCGPCIYKSREIKSVYEEFKNNDFTVVAVASKYRNISNVKRILECDKYPWTTLIDKPELDSRINEHYGIKNSGGITILIDKTGKIALVNPSANDVREYLKVNL